mmetsp:Transcript_23671/g.64218  ORF Transcript_23671/g.64218 Transcript_23671/m.64218 type:complete len:449 (+) Transcript_23671:59-1405(+)
MRDSANRRDKFKELQSELLQEDLIDVDQCGELAARHEVRWTGCSHMLSKLRDRRETVDRFYQEVDPYNANVFSAADWQLNLETSSIIEEPASVTMRMQGGEERFISSNTVLVSELKAVMSDSSIDVRSSDPSATDRVTRAITSLAPPAQVMLKVIVDEMDTRDLGTPKLDHEIISALLDPRYKGEEFGLFDEEGYTEARVVLQEKYDEFAAALRAHEEKEAQVTQLEAQLQNASELVERARAELTTGLPAASAPLAQAPAAEPEPASEPKQKKQKSMVEMRREKRLQEKKAARAEAAPAAAAPRARDEIKEYFDLDDELEDDNFSLLGWWKRMATDRPADNWFAWKVLSQLARVYHGIDATSCVAERNFSQLAIKLGPLERDGDPDHVADTLFLKANSQLIPDVQAWNLMRRFLSERGIEAGSTPADIAAACKEFILKHGPTSSSAGE